MLKTDRAPTSRLYGKAKPLTKLKPSKVRRKPIPELTWSGCAFATRGTLIYGRTLLKAVAVPRFARNNATPKEPDSPKLSTGRVPREDSGTLLHRDQARVFAA